MISSPTWVQYVRLVYYFDRKWVNKVSIVLNLVLAKNELISYRGKMNVILQQIKAVSVKIVCTKKKGDP